MSDGDVDPGEMDTPHDFDDAASEALLGGTARAAEPELSRLMDDVRTAFASHPPVVGTELSALMAGTPAAPTHSARRFERMRSSIIAKIAAGAAAAMAATGGLAVAGALPAPVQHALSNVGIGQDSHHATHATEVNDEETSTTLAGDTTTTEPGDNEGSTPTSVESGDNHGGEVSGTAHDGGDGCEHGASVSAVASDGRSQNDGSQCVTTSTTPGDTTPTTVDDGNHGRGNDGEGDNGNDNGGNDGHDGTPPTTAAGGTTPTTEHHGDGGGQHGGHDGGGDQSGDSSSGGGD